MPKRYLPPPDGQLSMMDMPVHSRDDPPYNKRHVIPDDREPWFCGLDTFRNLVSHGYTRLCDCPEVMMCVNVYAELISSMTLHLRQNTDKGDKRIKNGLSTKLDISPNDLMTRKTFMHNLVRVLMLEGEGNQVTVPIFNDSLLENLKPLPPSQVIFRDLPGDTYEIVYKGTTYAPDEVLHFVINPNPEKPYRGTGYRVILRDILAGLKQAGHTKKKILESPAPSIIVKIDNVQEEFASSDGRRKLRHQYLDSSENGEPWMIPAGVMEPFTVKPLTLKDLALADNITLDKRAAAAIFRVPPFMVGVGDFNEKEYNHFVRTSIMPFAKVLEQEFSRKLIYAEDYYVRFNPWSLFSYDLATLIEAGSEMVDRMALRRNEWRDMIGKEPDDEMDELLGLENFIPASMLGKQKKLVPDGGEENAGRRKRKQTIPERSD